MTDSTRHDRGSKRQRLVASASDLLHRQGVQATTLAHAANAADVPVGNVYYYFKTKDDLVRAVIDARAEQARTMLASLEIQPDPRARLTALVHSWHDMRDLVARHGCPFGTLSAELDKREDALTDAAATLIKLILDWTEDQFRQLGRPDARELAITLFATVQGAAQLTNTFRDPDLMTQQMNRLEDWITTLTLN